MINERMEYQYLLSAGYNNLLEKNAKKPFSGIKRPLLILARGMNEKLQKNGFAPADRYAYLRQFLQVWFMGNFDIEKWPKVKDFKEIKKDFTAANKNNLKAYYVSKSIFPKDVATAKEKKSTKKTTTKVFEDKLANFQMSIFSGNGKNDYYRIFFDDVIAEALYLGPLKSEKLIIKGDIKKKESSKKKDNTYGVEVIEKGGRTISTAAQRRKVLAIAAFYLQQKVEGQHFARVNKTDISNYVGIQAASDAKLGGIADFTNRGVLVYSENKQPIIRTDGTNRKIAFNAQWLEDFDVRLIDEKEPVLDGYVPYFDEDLRK